MEEKKYTYWLIYLIDEEAREKFLYPATYDKTSKLYAYTTDKKLMKLFAEQRNMKIFHIKKKEVDRGYVNFLAEVYPSLNLTTLDGKTMSETHELVKYKVAVTNYEFNMTFAEAGFMHHTEMSKTPNGVSHIEWAGILKPEYQYLLYKLGYLYFYDPDRHLKIQEKIGDRDPEDLPFIENDPYIDQLVIFIKKYKDLLK